MSTVSRTISYRHTAGSHIGHTGAVDFKYDPTRPFEVALDFGAAGASVWVVGRDVLARRIKGDYRVCCSVDRLWLSLTLAGAETAVTIRFMAADVDKFLADAERLVPYGEERIDMDAGLALLLGGAA